MACRPQLCWLNTPLLGASAMSMQQRPLQPVALQHQRHRGGHRRLPRLQVRQPPAIRCIASAPCPILLPQPPIQSDLLVTSNLRGPISSTGSTGSAPTPPRPWTAAWRATPSAATSGASWPTSVPSTAATTGPAPGEPAADPSQRCGGAGPLTVIMINGCLPAWAADCRVSASVV